MPRANKPVPSYRMHKATGQPVVTIPGPTGRRDVYLGRYGSPESKIEYTRIIAQVQAGDSNPRRSDLPAEASSLKVSELLSHFLDHADAYYRHPDGTPTSEPRNYRHSIRELRTLFGTRSLTSLARCP